MAGAIPKREFYYLRGLQAKPINRRLLNEDIHRGVRRITEDAYSTNWGSTQASLQFFLALINAYGEDFVKANKAEMKFSKKNWFSLHLYTVQGFEIVFSGMASGYFGEGPRGCHDILRVAGFSEKQCTSAFSKETFTCSRKV